MSLTIYSMFILNGAFIFRPTVKEFYVDTHYYSVTYIIFSNIKNNNVNVKTN